jgi:GDPmannose 4,6-dehydratase
VRRAAGSQEKLVLGNIQIQRDWGWAPDYVEAMWRMLQQTKADDFVFATGETQSLGCFVEAAFAAVRLDWREFVVSDSGLFRPTDLAVSCANPAKAARLLGWRAKHKMADVVRLMIAADKTLSVAT